MAPKRKRTSSPESASSSGTGTTYQVFLSFRGPDTRDTITDVLYHDLVREGIRVFRDDEEIRKGEDIGDEIRRAISDSKIFVPIFSKGYASSKWCLMELAMFKAIQESDSDKKILPIFFKVGVNDVKRKTKLYNEALEKHREKFSHDEVQRWEEALRKAGGVKGWELKGRGMGYGEFSKSFVREVSEKLKVKHKYVTDKIVQRDDQLEALMNMLDIKASDVRFVGIHGMGGIGKTTLAKMVFNKLCDGYEHCSFLPNVRESSQQHKGIEHLQKELLGNLGSTSQDIVHVDDGIMQLSQNYRSKKVLIVIDDVDHGRQIENLAGDDNWFGKGSRIIITTRDVKVLGGRVKPFELMELNAEEALRLFSKHAFGTDSPPNDFLDLSKEAVQSTGRLPLALEVIGSELREMPNHKKWAKTIERLKKIPHKDVREKLMISYKSLSNRAKQIFLDIACFFIDHERTNPMYMWEACDSDPMYMRKACDSDAKTGLKQLINKSLVKMDTWNGKTKVKCFRMHDLLRDLGRDIAKFSRILGREDGLNLLRQVEDRPNVEMLRLHEHYYSFDLEDTQDISWEEFSGLKKLRHLECWGKIDSCNMRGLLPNLRWLRWGFCPAEFTGTGLSLKKLVILDLSLSDITEGWTGWSKIGEANNLKVLDLSGCQELRRTPDLSKYSRLERLILRYCQDLVEIDRSIGRLRGLKFLDLNNCTSLRGLPDELYSLDCLEVILGDLGLDVYEDDLPEYNFPESIGNLTSLLTLGFSLYKTTRIPESIIRLSRLRYLGLSGVVELPQGVGQLENLETLELTNCPEMKKLPDSIGDMKSLVLLTLIESGITELPETIGNLEDLRVIYLDGSPIRKLPNSIGKLKSLEELTVGSCDSLTRIPACIGMLKNLRKLSARDCLSLKKLPSTIKGCTLLRTLDLTGCEKIKKLPVSDFLRSLHELRLPNHLYVDKESSDQGLR